MYMYNQSRRSFVCVIPLLAAFTLTAFGFDPKMSPKLFEGAWHSSKKGCEENAAFLIQGDSAFYTDRDPLAFKRISDTLVIGDDKYLYSIKVDSLRMRPIGTKLEWLYINRHCK